MNCDTCSKQLSAYIDDVLSIEETTAIAHHLNTCIACQEALEILYTLRESMQDIDAIKLPEGFHEALMQKVAQIPQEVVTKPVTHKRMSTMYRYGAGLVAAAMCFFALRSLPGQDALTGDVQESAGISLEHHKDVELQTFEMVSPAQNRTLPQHEQWYVEVPNQETSYTLLVNTLLEEGYAVEGTPFEMCSIYNVEEEQVEGLVRLIEGALGQSVHNNVPPVEGTVQVLLQTIE